MKTKLVLWGADKDDNKILVALELMEEENKVKTYTFEESVATEIFYNQMVNEWRIGHEVPFPEHQAFENPLSLSESILPEDIKVERTDLVNRAKTEWHFVVLSAKLHNMYQNELHDLKEKADNLTSFDSKLWQEMKLFWDKVQAQVFEKNLFREHGNNLKKQTNALFDSLKKHRKSFDDEFKTKSKEHVSEFMGHINNLGEKIEKGLGLQPIFEELKDIQKRFRDTKFTRDDRSKVWNKLDGTFKKLKEIRYGGKQGDQRSSLARLENRYSGLMNAIGKMNNSIGRDEKDLNFQNKRKEVSDGQLEMQIREAKAQMILGRINSKKEKLDDMMKTKIDLEHRLEIEKKKEEERKIKEEVKQKENEVKQKLAAEIKEKAKLQDVEKLEKAATAIKGKEGISETISDAVDDAKEALGDAREALGDVAEDVVDTAKAVAKVIKDRLTKDGPDEAAEEGQAEEKESVVDQVKDAVGDAVDAAKSVVEDIKDRLTKDGPDEAAEEGEVEEKESVVDQVKDAVGDAVDAAKSVVEDIKDRLTKDGPDEAAEEGEAEEKESVVDQVKDAVEDAFDDVVDSAKAVVQEIKDRLKGDDEKGDDEKGDDEKAKDSSKEE